MWPGVQFWDGVTANAAPRNDMMETKPNHASMQSQLNAAQIARLQHQCVGNLQATFLSGVAPHSPAPGCGVAMGCCKPDGTETRSFVMQDGTVPTGGVPMGLNGYVCAAASCPMPTKPAGLVPLPMSQLLSYDAQASQASAVAQQLPAHYWQQALALAAVQQAAVTGQVILRGETCG